MLFQRKETAKILHLNVRSLIPHLLEIKLLLAGFVIHVLTLSQTWLDSTVSDSEVTISGYSMCRNDRDRHGGGVVCSVSDSYLHAELSELLADCIESLATRHCLS